MKPLRAAVIGLGWAGEVHARALAQMPGVDLVALADPDPSRRAAFPGHRTTANADELLCLDLDYCVVATPTATHEEIATQLATASIAALVEKPLAPDAAAAWRIADAFQRTGVLAAAGHTERHNAANAELARRLHRGDHGTLWQVSTRRQGPYPGRIRDVGVARDLAVHDLDLLAWFTGQPIATITATTATIVGPFEDTATATALLRDGTLGHLHADWLTPYKRRSVEVHTEDGVLVADAVAGTLTLHPNTAEHRREAFVGITPGSARPIPLPRVEAPFTVENRLMLQALQGGPIQDLVSLAAAATAVAATDTLLTAAAAGRATTVRRRNGSGTRPPTADGSNPCRAEA
ncbi:Gfo/Idh/MocA family protein [Kitasatospora sp. NPDC059088]|uniref:Gfo/Idh/MocA family protein n=1 Tax=Kitasatospora sp. NPDC059088 TaxID=3346722 RepID=UPI00369785C3